MTHVRLTDRLRDQAALYALGALAPEERAIFARHLAEGCSPCRAEVESFDGVAGTLALAAPPVPPRPEVRERVLTEARASAPSPFRFLLRREGEWIRSQPGVCRKDLETEAAAGATSLSRPHGARRARRHPPP